MSRQWLVCKPEDLSSDLKLLTKGGRACLQPQCQRLIETGGSWGLMANQSNQNSEFQVQRNPVSKIRWKAKGKDVASPSDLQMHVTTHVHTQKKV